MHEKEPQNKEVPTFLRAEVNRDQDGEERKARQSGLPGQGTGGDTGGRKATLKGPAWRQGEQRAVFHQRPRKQGNRKQLREPSRGAQTFSKAQKCTWADLHACLLPRPGGPSALLQPVF